MDELRKHKGLHLGKVSGLIFLSLGLWATPPKSGTGQAWDEMVQELGGCAGVGKATGAEGRPARRGHRDNRKQAPLHLHVRS